jgi:transcriptional regulator with XRE-family HTH domain
MRDYRDKLRELLEEIHGRDGKTRYRISKISGISEQTLSNVMHKRRNLSIEALQQLLDSLGYEIHFVATPTSEKQGERMPEGKT